MQGDSVLRDTFPSGPLERGRTVVGAWFPVGFVVPGDGAIGEWVGFRAAWTDVDGRAAHATARHPVESVGELPGKWARSLPALRQGEAGTSRGFGDCVREMMGLGESWPDMPDNLDSAMLQVAGRAGLPDIPGAVEARRTAIAASVKPFLDTIDRNAWDAACAAYGTAGVDACWDSYGGSRSGEASLKEAVEAWPMLAGTLLAAWTADRARFASYPGRHGWLGTAVRHLGETTDIAPRCLRLVEAAHDARLRQRQAMSPSARAVEDGFGLRGKRDPAIDTLAWLSAVPPGMLPRDAREWDSFTPFGQVLRHALSHAGTRCGDAPQPGFLNPGRRWEGWDRWAEGLGAAAGLRGAVGNDLANGLLDCLHSCLDVADTYSNQVVVPSLLLGDGHGLDHEPRREWVDRVRDAVRAATWSGRGLHRILHEWRRWRGAWATIDGMRASLPGAEDVAPSWAACLPDHVADGLSMRILRNGREVALAGLDGAEGEMAGLFRPTGTVTGDCLRGKLRVGLVRRLPNGDNGDVLSMAWFHIGDRRIALGMHVGAGEAEPSRECEGFVQGYLGVAGAPGAVRWNEAWNTHGGADGVTAAAGYAWWAPGNLETMERAWRPNAPAWAHGLGPDGWSNALVEFGMAPGSRAARRERAPSPGR